VKTAKKNKNPRESRKKQRYSLDICCEIGENQLFIVFSPISQLFFGEIGKKI